MTRAFYKPEEFLNPQDAKRAEDIQKKLEKNNRIISKLVEKQMKQELTEKELQVKSYLFKSNDLYVTELKAMTRKKGKIGVKG